MDQSPRSVTVEALASSPDESRAFPRWYTDSLLRKRSDTVTIGDVTSFVDNFGVQPAQKRAIERSFGEPLVTLDPPQFYIYLRSTGHSLQGKQVRKELAFVAAPVPKPRSILAKRTQSAVEDSPQPKTDMDSFLSSMTGNSAGGAAHGSSASANGVRKRKKRVTFDSKPPQITEAAHRSMSESLRQAQIQEQYNSPQQPQLFQQNPPPQAQGQSAPAPKQDAEPEPDQPIVNNQFAHVNIDSVSHNGQSMSPEPPAPRKTKAGDSFIQQLTQSASGSVENPTSHQNQHQNQPQSSAFQHPQHLQNHQIPQLNTPAPPPSRSQSGNQFVASSSPQSSGMPANSGLQPNSTGSSGLQPNSTGLHPNSTGLHPNSTGLHPNSTGLQPNSTGLQPNSTGWTSLAAPRQKLGPQSTGSLPVSMQPQSQSQLSGQPPMPQIPGNMMGQVSGHLTGQMPGQMTGQMTGQVGNPGGLHPPMAPMSHMAGISPQITGISPQISGQHHISPQVSGSQNISHMHIQPPMAHQIQPPPPQQQQQHLQPNAQNGYAQPPSQFVQPGMQFINSVQNPAGPQNPSQPYQYGQAYNMQSSRNGMPNW